MEKKIYTAVFHPEPEAGGYSVFFPICRAVIHRATPCAKPSIWRVMHSGYISIRSKRTRSPFRPRPILLTLRHGRDFTTLIEWDEEAYLRRTDNRSVKKTLTIPAWMDTLAREHNINFSQLLQNAIRRECGIQV